MSEKYQEFEFAPEQARVFLRNTRGWGKRAQVFGALKALHAKNVLDVGCGNGNDSWRYSPGNYVGVDISSSLVAAAREEFPRHEYYVASCTALPFADNQFEAAFCISLIEHLHTVNEASRTIREMLRVSSLGAVIGWHTTPWSKPTRTEKSRLEGASTSYWNRGELLLGLQVDIDEGAIGSSGYVRSTVWTIRDFKKKSTG